jgi:hypothetical protein
MAQTVAVQAHPLEDSEITSPTYPPKTITAAPEDTQRPIKRLTPSFPVLLPTSQVHADHQTSLSPKYSSPAESARSSPRLAPQPASPTDPNAFLTTLAAQERRVLELREELQKAESDLAGLKKQWAIFEANRKKSGVRHVEQLQPLSASHLSKTDSGGDIPTPLNLSTYEKLAAKPTRKPQQRVFSGSRHTRTLSLLTTASGESNKQYPEPYNDARTTAETGSENKTKDAALSRSSTMPNGEINAGFGKTYKNLANRRSMPPASADALVKTGKQMASDLRDGLWTFFEDIRQATVGEEGINGTDTRSHSAIARQKSTPKSSVANGPHRKKRSNTGLESSSQKPLYSDHSTPAQDYTRTDNGPEQSFWKEFGVDTPGRGRPLSQMPPAQPREPEQPQQQREGLLVDVDDDWDVWESPVSLQKTSPRRDAGGTPMDRNSNSTAAASADALPWPTLTKLTPSKLTRTVSDMMRDWDSPYPGQSTSHSDVGEQVLTSPHV